MSDIPPVPPPIPSTLPPSSGRSGCLTAFMVVAGIILLLPGLCALVFGSMSLSDGHYDGTVTAFVLVGLLVGFAGVIVLWAAFRKPRP